MTEIPIFLRCFVDDHIQKDGFEPKNPINPSNSIELVFDTETKPDQSKDLVFGSCGLWINNKLEKLYVFYNDNLKNSEILKLENICLKFNAILMPRSKFVDEIFYPHVFVSRAKCIGFNLPFDISRLATYFTKSRKHYNGFSLTLSENKHNPNIVIKSLNSKSQFIEFTKPLRKKSEKILPIYRGCFIDCKTLAFALTNESYSLENALIEFGCSMRKLETKEHGIISQEYVEYNINDTLATRELYIKLMERYKKYGLKKLESKLFSPASIGKGYLEKIGIQSFTKLNPDFPKEILGYTMMTYYGGRTETMISKTPIPVSYVDFTNMYPTIFVLLEMYKFLVAKKITFQYTTNKTQNLLDTILLEDICKKETWKDSAIICRIIPDEDILPVRSTYGNKNTTNIGINYLKSTDGTSLWYTIHDLIASKFLTGKTPKILEAITFLPEGIQPLQDIEVLKGITVRNGDDFIKKIVEERLRIKKLETKESEINQNILKTIANSTSYGIFIQIDPKHTKNQKVTIHGLDSFDLSLDKTEDQGAYFNSIMAVFLPAGSRLVLATAETLVKNNGGYVAYCDTDSVFISPQHVGLVQEFFKPLNPYNQKVEMFKVETDKKTKKILHNVQCIAISAKRYVLYDYVDGKITIYKYSLHGLGYLKGIDGKQVWHDFILIHHHPERKKEILSKYKDKHAKSHLAITNYDILKRFDGFNKSKPYSSKIKPYNFATVGTACKIDPVTKERIIPFLSVMDKDKLDEIPYMEFLDYKTGKKYPNDDSMEPQFYWKTMESVLKDYLEHKESKLEGDSGVLKRRHLTINQDSIRYIGKESNELEESQVLGVTRDDTVEYVNDQEKLRKIIKNLTLENTLEIGISRRTFFYLKKKVKNPNSIILKYKLRKKLFQFD